MRRLGRLRSLEQEGGLVMVEFPQNSIPADASACIAQLVEHVLGKDEVTGSIPVAGSM